MSLTLVILAAGMGSRYGGDKPLASVGPTGETLLEYAGFDALRAGFDRVVMVVRPDTEETVRARLATGMDRKVPVAYVHQRLDDLPEGRELPTQRSKPWGTGQAVLTAAQKIDGPFVVINADDFYGAASYRSMASFLRRRAAGPSPRSARAETRLAVVGFPVGETVAGERPVSRGLLELDHRQRLRRIVELREVWRQNGRIYYRNEAGDPRSLSREQQVSMNMWGLTPDVLGALRRDFADFLADHGESEAAEFLLPEAVQAMIRGQRYEVEVLAGGGPWCGITHSQDLNHARSSIAAQIEKGFYPEKLWA